FNTATGLVIFYSFLVSAKIALCVWCIILYALHSGPQGLCYLGLESQIEHLIAMLVLQK
ncbi:hypothetical protein J6590_054980, partial [Homalodisca vitripennis]